MVVLREAFREIGRLSLYLLRNETRGITMCAMDTATRLIPPKRGNYPPVDGLALRVYGSYAALLSRSAFEALGSPPAVAVEVDERGYSIVPTTREDRLGIRVYGQRKLSLGVISAA